MKRYTDGHYVDFIVKHHVNHFRFQSLSTLSIYGYTFLRYNKILIFNADSGYSCVPNVYITKTSHALQATCNADSGHSCVPDVDITKSPTTETSNLQITVVTRRL